MAAASLSPPGIGAGSLLHHIPIFQGLSVSLGHHQKNLVISDIHDVHAFRGQQVTWGQKAGTILTDKHEVLGHAFVLQRHKNPEFF